MKKRIGTILAAMILAVPAWGQSAPPSLGGYGLNGSTQVVLNSTGILGVLGFAPPSATLNGLNATAVSPGYLPTFALPTYTSGITATGSTGQSCTITITGGSTNAVGSVLLTGTNAIATGAVIKFVGAGLSVGGGFATAPTSGTASNGITNPATCSGTATISTVLGAYTPLPVDANGNLIVGGAAGGVLSGTFPSPGFSASPQALPNGWTATTQPSTDTTSAKVATQASVVALIGAVGASSAASLSISGQTGLLSFTGLTSTNRIKTVRDAADTILELGGSYTPTATWDWTSATVTWPTFNQPTSGTAASLSGALAANQLLGSLTAVAPTGLSVPSCSTAASALQWTSGSGFGCNTSMFILPSLTSGSILFSDGSTISQDNSNFFWNATNKSLGIRTKTPLGVLSLNPGNVSDLGTFAASALVIDNYSGSENVSQIGFGYTAGGTLTNATAALTFTETSAAGFGKGNLCMSTRNVTTDTAPTSTLCANYDGTVTVPQLKSTSGTRYVCVDSNGILSSSVLPCSGT